MNEALPFESIIRHGQEYGWLGHDSKLSSFTIADERTLGIPDNYYICRISQAPLPYKNTATARAGKVRWFGHATRRPKGELTKDLLLPTPPRTWRSRAGCQLKIWATTIKANLEPISGQGKSV